MSALPVTVPRTPQAGVFRRIATSEFDDLMKLPQFVGMNAKTVVKLALKQGKSAAWIRDMQNVPLMTAWYKEQLETRRQEQRAYKIQEGKRKQPLFKKVGETLEPYVRPEPPAKTAPELREIKFDTMQQETGHTVDGAFPGSMFRIDAKVKKIVGSKEEAVSYLRKVGFEVEQAQKIASRYLYEKPGSFPVITNESFDTLVSEVIGKKTKVVKKQLSNREVKKEEATESYEAAKVMSAKLGVLTSEEAKTFLALLKKMQPMINVVDQVGYTRSEMRMVEQFVDSKLPTFKSFAEALYTGNMVDVVSLLGYKIGEYSEIYANIAMTRIAEKLAQTGVKTDEMTKYLSTSSKIQYLLYERLNKGCTEATKTFPFDNIEQAKIVFADLRRDTDFILGKLITRERPLMRAVIRHKGQIVMEDRMSVISIKRSRNVKSIALRPFERVFKGESTSVDQMSSFRIVERSIESMCTYFFGTGGPRAQYLRYNMVNHQHTKTLALRNVSFDNPDNRYSSFVNYMIDNGWQHRPTWINAVLDSTPREWFHIMKSNGILIPPINMDSEAGMPFGTLKKEEVMQPAIDMFSDFWREMGDEPPQQLLSRHQHMKVLVMKPKSDRYKYKYKLNAKELVEMGQAEAIARVAQGAVLSEKARSIFIPSGVYMFFSTVLQAYFGQSVYHPKSQGAFEDRLHGIISGSYSVMPIGSEARAITPTEAAVYPNLFPPEKLDFGRRQRLAMNELIIPITRMPWVHGTFDSLVRDMMNIPPFRDSLKRTKHYVMSDNHFVRGRYLKKVVSSEIVSYSSGKVPESGLIDISGLDVLVSFDGKAMESSFGKDDVQEILLYLSGYMGLTGKGREFLETYFHMSIVGPLICSDGLFFNGLYMGSGNALTTFINTLKTYTIAERCLEEKDFYIDQVMEIANKCGCEYTVEHIMINDATKMDDVSVGVYIEMDMLGYGAMREPAIVGADEYGAFRPVLQPDRILASYLFEKRGGKKQLARLLNHASKLSSLYLFGGDVTPGLGPLIVDDFEAVRQEISTMKPSSKDFSEWAEQSENPLASDLEVLLTTSLDPSKMLSLFGRQAAPEGSLPYNTVTEFAMLRSGYQPWPMGIDWEPRVELTTRNIFSPNMRAVLLFRYDSLLREQKEQVPTIGEIYKSTMGRVVRDEFTFDPELFPEFMRKYSRKLALPTEKAYLFKRITKELLSVTPEFASSYKGEMDVVSQQKLLMDAHRARVNQERERRKVLKAALREEAEAARKKIITIRNEGAGARVSNEELQKLGLKKYLGHTSFFVMKEGDGAEMIGKLTRREVTIHAFEEAARAFKSIKIDEKEENPPDPTGSLLSKLSSKTKMVQIAYYASIVPRSYPKPLTYYQATKVNKETNPRAVENLGTQFVHRVIDGLIRRFAYRVMIDGDWYSQVNPETKQRGAIDESSVEKLIINVKESVDRNATKQAESAIA